MIFEKIREMLQKKSFVDYEECYTDNGECLISISEVFDIINQVEAEYNNGWIKCDDKLPDIETKYLVCLENGGITISKFESILDGNGYLIPIWKNCIKTKVEYWQPLPEPYISIEEPLWKESMMNHFTKGE